MTFKRLAIIAFSYSLKSRLLCYTLSKAFEISRKTPLTSRPSSVELYILCVIDIN